MRRPRLLVLDFDGVICDGMKEFFESSWRTQVLARQRPPDPGRREQLSARFAALRPVIESGWEMVVLLAILGDRAPEQDDDLKDSKKWAEVRDAHVEANRLDRVALGDEFDKVRDRWFATDADGWRETHGFYPEIAMWLRQVSRSEVPVYILSTKEKRFIEYLLQWQQVLLPADRIIGKQKPKREKYEVVRELIQKHRLSADGEGVWFVEDRLETLTGFLTHAKDLSQVELYLAEWGYIFRDRDLPAVGRDGWIQLLTRQHVAQGFDAWPAPRRKEQS